MKNGTVLYFSHGGGPLPLLGDPSHQAMITFMQQLPQKYVTKPDAIVVISAHWEAPTATLLSGASPEMYYDYYGFPEESYAINYPAPGNPKLATTITQLLTDHHIPSSLDPQRGFDHGLFIPLTLMYPQADIPALQLSLVQGLDPTIHLQLGKALRVLLQENILIIGSGFSFHNMRAFSWDSEKTPDAENNAFQDWLIDICTGSYTAEEREQQLAAWTGAPGARYCHPREEHLLPLHVCQGLAGDKAQTIFDDYILGKRAVAFLW